MRADRIRPLCLALLLLAGALCGCAAQANETVPALLVEITAFNVGKADAILVRVGEKTYLIDAGLEKGFGDLRRALERENVTRLDGVFLTHVDKDHGGGMVQLAGTDIEIDAFYASPFYFKRTEADHQLIQAAAMRGMEVVWLQAGEAVPIGEDCLFEVQGPLQFDPEDENNNSLVLKLITPEGCALLAGDMEKDAEKDLLKAIEDPLSSLYFDLSAAYLKVGHHGRDDATGKKFAQAVKPEIAVISTDSIEEPRSADPDVIERLEALGAAVYVTENYENGVKVRLTGGHAVRVEN
ncbi:MAG: MBL fold metallo-hydrolase [Clostridia bacterium]|nr:MBL fold metallo-hydrolase [Clostridia bacterium]